VSFDLYFYSKNEDPEVNRHIKEYFAGKKFFNVKALENEGSQFWYENENTGVYFCFDLTTQPDEEDGEKKEGYYYIGLTFNINYMRPMFFSYEAMPIVEEISQKLGLLIADPQDKGNPDGIPKEYKADELMDSWNKSNEWATDIYKQKGANLYYLDGSLSKLIWEYLMQKDELQEKLGDTTFVPKLFIIRLKDSAKLYTAITWNQSISEVIPKCDYLLIMQEKSKWFGLSRTTSRMIVPYTQVVERLGSYLEPFDSVIPGTMILRPEKQFDALPEFNKLVGAGFDNFEGVNVESFVDFIVSPKQYSSDSSDSPEVQSIPMEYNPINMNTEEGFQDFEFNIVEYCKLENGNHMVKVCGEYDNKIVSIKVEFLANMISGVINNDFNSKAFYHEGIIIRLIETESEEFVKALFSLYGQKNTGKKIVEEVKLTSYALEGNPGNFENENLMFKVFHDDNNRDGLYFELYININLSKSILEIKEKDVEYRKNICNTLIGKKPNFVMRLYKRLFRKV